MHSWDRCGHYSLSGENKNHLHPTIPRHSLKTRFKTFMTLWAPLQWRHTHSHAMHLFESAHLLTALLPAPHSIFWISMMESNQPLTSIFLPIFYSFVCWWLYCVFLWSQKLYIQRSMMYCIFLYCLLLPFTLLERGTGNWVKFFTSHFGLCLFRIWKGYTNLNVNI